MTLKRKSITTVLESLGFDQASGKYFRDETRYWIRKSVGSTSGEKYSDITIQHIRPLAESFVQEKGNEYFNLGSGRRLAWPDDWRELADKITVIMAHQIRNILDQSRRRTRARQKSHQFTDSSSSEEDSADDSSSDSDESNVNAHIDLGRIAKTTINPRYPTRAAGRGDMPVRPSIEESQQSGNIEEEEQTMPKEGSQKRRRMNSIEKLGLDHRVTGSSQLVSPPSSNLTSQDTSQAMRSTNQQVLIDVPGGLEDSTITVRSQSGDIGRGRSLESDNLPDIRTILAETSKFTRQALPTPPPPSSTSRELPSSQIASLEDTPSFQASRRKENTTHRSAPPRRSPTVSLSRDLRTIEVGGRWFEVDVTMLLDVVVQKIKDDEESRDHFKRRIRDPRVPAEERKELRRKLGIQQETCMAWLDRLEASGAKDVTIEDDDEEEEEESL